MKKKEWGEAKAYSCLFYAVHKNISNTKSKAMHAITSSITHRSHISPNIRLFGFFHFGCSSSECEAVVQQRPHNGS